MQVADIPECMGGATVSVGGNIESTGSSVVIHDGAEVIVVF